MATLRCPRCQQKMAQVTESGMVIIHADGRTWKFETPRITFYCRCGYSTTKDTEEKGCPNKPSAPTTS